jgi:hypothetical protein
LPANRSGPGQLQFFAGPFNRMAQGNNRAPYLKARNFLPGRVDTFGEWQPLPVSERWGDIQYAEDLRQEIAKEAKKNADFQKILRDGNFGEKNAAIKEQLRRLKKLDEDAKRAAYIKEIMNPDVGDFKTDTEGKLFRFTDRYWKKTGQATAEDEALPEKVNRPTPGQRKKIGRQVFVWAEEPAWLQVDRKTNYDIDLADTFARYDALGKPYLNARDSLWSIYYPGEAAIYRPARFRGRRNTRRANRRTNRRKNNTRKS